MMIKSLVVYIIVFLISAFEPHSLGFVVRRNKSQYAFEFFVYDCFFGRFPLSAPIHERTHGI